MRRWIEDEVYNERPRTMMVGGAVMCFGSVAWLVVFGDFTLWQGAGLVLGAGLLISGAGILLRRHQYRARSMWQRTMQL
jgi:drug/metabolite transporter (DMT)-like permease